MFPNDEVTPAEANHAAPDLQPFNAALVAVREAENALDQAWLSADATTRKRIAKAGAILAKAGAAVRAARDLDGAAEEDAE